MKKNKTQNIYYQSDDDNDDYTVEVCCLVYVQSVMCWLLQLMW